MPLYEELGSIKEPVELSPTEALTSAEELLRRQGYRIIHHTHVMVVGKRENAIGLVTRGAVHLAVFARPHPEGGLRITLQGDDREGVRERQEEWSRWAEGLPKVRSWENKEHQREPEKTSSIETRRLRPERQKSEAATTTEPGQLLVSGERKEESHVSKSTGHEVRWRPADGGGEGKGRGKSSGGESGAWTSVAPWERKVRIAPGKMDQDLSKPPEGPT
jgi:hypothetical protein